ncbi:MAG: hypothetical protein K8R25_09090 [Methanosarcinales archaeon]|nr:hypothetical protein [Methanosarcinales archaeon]
MDKKGYLTASMVLLIAMLTCIGIAGANTQLHSIEVEFENKLVPDALGEGQLLMPGDVTVLNNMIIVSDAGTSRVSLFDMNGTYIARFGSQGNTLTGEIEMPGGLTTDGENLYLAANPEIVTVWDVSEYGTEVDPFLAVPADETEIGPQNMAVDTQGNIYIICGPNHHNMSLPYRIIKYDPVGIWQAEADVSSFTVPGGLDVTDTYLFVSETNPMGDKMILIYDAENMALLDTELELPANCIPGDVDTVGTDIYVSVSSSTGGINGVIKYNISSLSEPPVYAQIVDTSSLQGMGMMVTGIDVDANSNIYVTAKSMMYSDSGQVIIYDSTGAQKLSFPEQIELLSIWGIDHDASNKVFMLPLSFCGSPVSILTANIDGTQLQELVDLDNSGGSFIKLDHEGHIWYSQLGFEMPNWDMVSSGVYALDMDGNELYNLVTYNTSLTIDPASGETITDGTRSLQIPTGIDTSTEDGKHYLYVSESKITGMLDGGSGLVTKFEYEFDPEWKFSEIWSTGTFIASEPARDLSADPPGQNEFSIPFGIALHPDGDVLYVVDENYWRVVMLDPDDGSWLGELVEAPPLPEGYTQYSESLAHVMAHDDSFKEAILMPLDVAVDHDTGFVYVSYHGGHGANVYTKTGEFVGHVDMTDIDDGGIIAGLNLDIVPFETDNKKHVVIGDGHGWSVGVYEVTTSESNLQTTTELTAEVIPAISMTVPTSNVDFGKVGSGMTSGNQVMTVVNTGAGSAKVSAMLLDDSDGFYNESLKLNDLGVSGFFAVVPSDTSDFQYEYEVVANLEVPDWAGGKYDGTIIFVAESDS